MSTNAEKKDSIGGWFLSVALWLTMILFAANQGMQAIAAHEEKHYTVRATGEMVCAVAVNGQRQTMECFRDEDEQ